MELLRLDERPAEFVWKDITIFYRTKVTSGDKYDLDTSGRFIKGDKIEFKQWELYRSMIRIFVTGWKGVTENGAEVPYTFETLLSRIPSEKGDDLIMKLGYQIAVQTGLFNPTSADDVEKNDSSGPSNG